jgi:hypothetical protein
LTFIAEGICYSQETANQSDSLKIKIEKKVNQFIYIISSPNPCKNKIRFRIYGLSTIDKEKFEFKIYNLLGFEVEDLSKIANDANDGTFSDFYTDFNHLNIGIYFALLSTEKYCNLYKFIKTE